MSPYYMTSLNKQFPFVNRWLFGDNLWCLKTCLSLRIDLYLLLVWCAFIFSSMTWYGLLLFYPSSMTWYGLILLYLCSMTWYRLLCLSLISSSMTWYELLLFISYLFFHDLILYCFFFSSMTWYGLLCYWFPFLPWLDMVYFVYLFLLSPWLDINLSYSFIFFPCVDNMFPIGFLWFILG